MKHVPSAIVCLIAIFMMATTSTSQAANFKNTKRDHRVLKGTTDVSRVLAYSFPAEKAQYGSDRAIEDTRVPLSNLTMASGMASPGVTVGNTWYDYQHNGSMGRMIAAGPPAGETGYTIVHMGWMYLPDKKLESRAYAYTAFMSEYSTLVSPFAILQNPNTEYAGYVNVDITPDNRAIVGGHNNQGDGTQPHFYFDGGRGYATFPNEVRIPDSVAGWGQVSSFEACWPKFFFQVGTDTVLHAVALMNDLSSTQAIMYFRRPGFESSNDTQWDYPPYIVDSVSSMAHDITGQKLGDRVAMAWTASLPYQEPECDTCSGISIYDTYLIGQMDNDVYYQMSNDQGNHWEPRVNVTNTPIGEAAYKAYSDISTLFDSDGNLHLIWTACPWAADLCMNEGGFCWEEDWYIDNARLFHWGENIPFIRVVASQVYEVQPYLWDSCHAGAWSLRISKPTLAECNGNLFAIWTQFNDPENGVIDDCAQWGYDDSDPTGAANGEIWLAQSSNGGMNWSNRRNLTNSYTPRCDPKFGEECQSDYWASMNRYGRMVNPGEDWSGAVVVDPSGGSYTGDYYLDIQYINDFDAGAIVQAEGTWTDNPVKWFRIPCVPFDDVPCPYVSPLSIGDPFYVLTGEAVDTPIVIENYGPDPINYFLTVEVDNGPGGWLGVSGLSGTVGSGLANVEVGTIHLNDGGIITSTGNYYGRIILDFPEVPCTRTVEIELVVVSIPPPIYYRDTVHTDCLALIVSPDGNMGASGYGKVNMDYYPEDCDTTAKIYMYDGSPLIGRIIGDDTVFNWSIWGTLPYDDEGLRPQGGSMATTYCSQIDAEVFQSGAFTTQDSAMAMERIWVAPQSDCNFILEYTRVWSWDGAAHEDIMIGEGIDWDVPWDYLADDPVFGRVCINTSGIDGPRNLVYQQGYDAHGLGSDTSYPYNCQFNDERFAGNAFVESHLNGSLRYPVAYSAFVGELDSLHDANGFVEGLLYQEMAYSGFRFSDSTEDLFTVLCYEPNLDFGPDDVYEAVTILATVQQGTLADLQAAVDDANAWYAANGGMNMFADDNDDGQIDVCVDCCEVMGDYNHDGRFDILDIDDFIQWAFGIWPNFPPYCEEEVDVSGATAGVPDGTVTILDIDFLIGYLLRGDPTPMPECP